MDRKWFNVYSAAVKREDLQIHFQRLYEDARDIMSDSPRPDWMGLDNFEITIIKVNTWVEVEKIDIGTIKRAFCKEVERFEIKTDSKKAANYIWYLGKKTETTYEQLKEMCETMQF